MVPPKGAFTHKLDQVAVIVSTEVLNRPAAGIDDLVHVRVLKGVSAHIDPDGTVGERHGRLITT